MNLSCAMDRIQMTDRSRNEDETDNGRKKGGDCRSSILEKVKGLAMKGGGGLRKKQGHVC